jgi:hypothetical protein
MAHQNQTVWRFRCVECGFGDGDFGHLLADGEIHCFVCLEETGTLVKLRRWVADEAIQARFRDVFAGG